MNLTQLKVGLAAFGETSWDELCEASVHQRLRLYVYKSSKKEDGRISREDFAFGYALYAFDLSADQCGGDHFNLVKQGNVRLNMKFIQAFANTINVIAFAELEKNWRLTGRGTFYLITRAEDERIENRIHTTEKSKMRSHVLGVFPCDRLHKRFKTPELLVCNTDPHYAPGEHWVVLYVENSSYGEYFDSFGRPPDAPFRTFLDVNCNYWIFNDRHLQSAISGFCGHYYIVYCLHSSVVMRPGQFSLIAQKR